MVDIAIAYMSGTSYLLDMCLGQLFRYTESKNVNVVVMMDIDQENDIQNLLDKYSVRLILCDVPKEPDSVSTPHQIFLDAAFADTYQPLFLAMDSDTFVLHDDWLGILIENMGTGVVSGISHCWPEPNGLDEGSMEFRVLSQTCYQTPQAACFLVRRSFVEEYNLGFGMGDDTCFAISKQAKKLGLVGSLLRPSHCGIPGEEFNFESEFNRSVGMVFGERVYHHGGASVKEVKAGERMLSRMFRNSLDRVLKDGPEILLKEGYRYRFDREDQVREFRLKAVREQIVEYLLTHERLFRDA